MSIACAPASQSTAVPQTRDELLSWGRYPRVAHASVIRVYWADQVPPALTALPDHGGLPYGLGRSYGDSCLNDGRTLIDCSRMRRILAFDRQTGRIHCEAGVSLADILEIAVPAGWFLPVTPGTKFVTVAGAIANDVHGKNHHRAGTFGRHVTHMEIARSDDGAVSLSPECNRDLFCATVGGLGLTGVILSAELQLKAIPGDRIHVETIPFDSLQDFLALTKTSDASFEYTVAWVDCLAGRRVRGIFIRGNHAQGFSTHKAAKPGPKVPFAFPEWVLNSASVKLLNFAYYQVHKLRGNRRLAYYDPFFYPLDSIRNWNLIYGSRGLVQYQCVIPQTAADTLGKLLAAISDSGQGSFLAVLKCFGDTASPGLLSFPRPGITLALDFPMRGQKTLQLLEALDALVLAAGGALYPAKDARMSGEMFQASFPNWRSLRRFMDPKLSSSFWRRVNGE